MKMTRDDLTNWFVDSRDGKEIDKWDFIGLALLVIGIAWGVVGLIVAGHAGGFGFFAVGILTLFRHHPGGA